jgi:hypothetical protein
VRPGGGGGGGHATEQVPAAASRASREKWRREVAEGAREEGAVRERELPGEEEAGGGELGRHGDACRAAYLASLPCGGGGAGGWVNPRARSSCWLLLVCVRGPTAKGDLGGSERKICGVAFPAGRRTTPGTSWVTPHTWACGEEERGRTWGL